MSVTVYSKPSCVACTATYRKLNQLGVTYTTVDITEDPDARDYVLSLGHKAAPVVVLGDGTHWAGYNPDRLQSLV